MIGERKCSAWLPRKFIGPIDSRNSVAGVAMPRVTMAWATRPSRARSAVVKSCCSWRTAKACLKLARRSCARRNDERRRKRHKCLADQLKRLFFALYEGAPGESINRPREVSDFVRATGFWSRLICCLMPASN